VSYPVRTAEQLQEHMMEELIGRAAPSPGSLAELPPLGQALQAQQFARVAAGDPDAIERWFSGHCSALERERRRALR
jgi:hypothetical protein